MNKSIILLLSTFCIFTTNFTMEESEETKFTIREENSLLQAISRCEFKESEEKNNLVIPDHKDPKKNYTIEIADVIKYIDKMKKITSCYIDKKSIFGEIIDRVNETILKETKTTELVNEIINNEKLLNAFARENLYNLLNLSYKASNETFEGSKKRARYSLIIKPISENFKKNFIYKPQLLKVKDLNTATDKMLLYIKDHISFFNQYIEAINQSNISNVLELCKYYKNNNENRLLTILPTTKYVETSINAINSDYQIAKQNYTLTQDLLNSGLLVSS